MNNEEYQGARFYKCALQVNPCTYGLEYRGQPKSSAENYNQEVLWQCKQNKIKVVGLADHGGVKDSEGLRNFLRDRDKDLTVFPGFEISSSENIHMVCLYAEDTPLDSLNGHLAQLMGTNYAQLQCEPTHPSSLSCEDIAKKIDEQNGFWYAAHMTGKNGLLRLDGSGGNLVHLWKKEKVVIVGQIPGRIEDLQLEKEDLARYRKIIENKNLDYKREKPIVIINAKDIDKPETLSDTSASCLVKMTEPSFEAFRQAFHDPESRIRLNHDIAEPSYSVISSIQWEGKGKGFFEENTLYFSPNLNAVIGGRGTGKTTLIEGIRYVLERYVSEGSKVSNEFYKKNLGDSKITLSVKSRAQSSQCYTISRRFGERAIVKNKNGEVSNLSSKEILPAVTLLGQNEILEIVENDTAKRELMNGFLSGRDKFDGSLRESRKRMADNREKWIKADKEFENLDSSVQRIPMLQEQLKRFEDLGVSKKLKKVDLVGKEKNIQARVKEQVALVKDWLKRYEEVFDLEFLQESRISALPDRVILAKMRGALERLKEQTDGMVEQADKSLEDTSNELAALEKEWESEVEKIEDDLRQVKAQLPEQSGKPGSELGQEYTDIIEELRRIDRQKEEHRRQKQLIGVLKKEREDLMEEYRQTAFERYRALQEAVENLNENDLKGKVRLTVKRFGDLQPLKVFLLDIGGIGEARIKWLDEVADLNLLAWSKWAEKGNVEAFMKEYRSVGMQKSTAEKLSRLDLKKRLELEEIELEDKIEIELNIAHDGEEYKPLDSLSTGQQCTAILNLLLLNRDDPLIIDQPEDNLDNAFIADRIVRDLRKFKTGRQFIFATHNANIPVFGDAELIAVLHSEKDKGKVKEAGSIDKPAVRKQAAKILEGGKAAFEMRGRKYGY